MLNYGRGLSSEFEIIEIRVMMPLCHFVDLFGIEI